MWLLCRWVVNDIFGWLGEKQNVGMAISDIKLTYGQDTLEADRQAGHQPITRQRVA